MRWRIVVFVTALKVLLFPAYRSTDFEVHRNWLAITSSLPLRQWYTNTTSQWTLDYPPLFAWFEWALAQAAWLVDPAMLDVANLGYASDSTILFQRGSVIVSDAALISGAWFATRREPEPRRSLAVFLLVANSGLLLVDHVHFQYNGLLLGILVWSLALVREGRSLAGGVLFAVLLNMKHLFACLAPVYFVHLLRHHCRGPHAMRRFAVLGACVAGVFAVSFGPFVLAGQLRQVLGRLFPFQRGLCHAYWAANVWALYAAADKALAAGLQLLGRPAAAPAANLTGGLVGVSSFAVLPDVSPAAALALVLAALAPCLVRLWRAPDPAGFVHAVAYAAMCSFMAGYHVHEKAALMVTVPLALDAIRSRPAARDWLFLSATAHYALLPLLFTLAEYPIKVLIYGIYTPKA
ncbi:hypothetical protein WJX81_002987 [Elliptochloris bilobata]|uniref:Alpha-1,3-glucosyltransferase n=1 Tax=Elliptochloris bilobata TaxID=381761 RepID=A0AAW1R2R9_9CHLO